MRLFHPLEKKQMFAIGNLSKREKIILAPAVVLLAFSLVYNLALNPYFKKLAGLDREILQLENKLDLAKRLILRKGEIENDFQGLALGPAGKEGVSSEQGIASILIELEKISSLSGVRLTDVKPRPIKNNRYYGEFVIEARFEAGIEGVAKFIYEIQQSQELLKIEKLQLNIKSSEPSSLDGLLEIHKIYI